MKKFISILLSILMAFTILPMTAFADDQTISFDDLLNEEFSSPVDYNAYDSIIILVNSVDSNQYTKESFDALRASIVDKESLSTQEDVDNAVINIATAYSNLVKKSFDITFQIVDSKENVKTQTFTYSYGDVADFEVTDTDEVATKWVLSTDEADEKIDAQGNKMSLVITNSVTVVAVTDIAPEKQESVSQVKFLSITGKVFSIVYTTDAENVEMPEAPKVPFYFFDEWEKVDDTTYRAKYTSTLVCDGETHIYRVTIVDPTCTTQGYLIFECECGEAYSTEYKNPLGHDFSTNEHYCSNGCGKENDSYFETLEQEIKPTESVNPETPAEGTTDSTADEFSVDKNGYINRVVMP